LGDAVWQTPWRPTLKPLEFPFRMLETREPNFGPIRREHMNDQNRQGQGREVTPDPSPEPDSFILGLTPVQRKDASIENARWEENFRFADQLHAKALARGDRNAIELDRLIQGRISIARSSDHW
jgi:hypothetical protein